jgi:hypothetical protein
MAGFEVIGDIQTKEMQKMKTERLSPLLQSHGIDE